MTKKIVAVTACPTGVAHTFMAAEALEIEARKRGDWIKVETRGSVGAKNTLTAEEIAQADVVIIAADIELDLSGFVGKRLYRTSTGAALKKSAQEMDNAFNSAEVYQGSAGRSSSAGKTELPGVYKHLMTGVSHMLPLVVAGGLCIALSFVFGIQAFNEPGTLAAALFQIGGKAAFALMVPVLAGFIAFSIADRPGLAPGLIGGMLASLCGAGFLGGIVAGFLAGYSVRFLAQNIKLPASMEALTTFLGNMTSTNAILLGMLLGAMQGFDLGGPVNKAAYTFGVGLLASHSYMPMAAIMAAGMVPALGMGVATWAARAKFNAAEHEAGNASFILGLCFISEGAIPFAARDPMRVIPSTMVGGAIAGGLSMYFGCTLMAPHGGLFVLAIPHAVEHVMQYLLSIALGTIVCGLMYALLKPSVVAQTV
ncbi:PTS fructose transporter subunit IIBC [Salmonella enterica]|nr:PTS fructose transporter subunit IIBC [Salmonella enterica]